MGGLGPARKKIIHEEHEGTQILFVVFVESFLFFAFCLLPCLAQAHAELERIRTLLLEGKSAQALALAREHIEKFPNSAEANHLLGLALFQNRQP